MKKLSFFLVISVLLSLPVSGQPLTVCNNSLIYISQDTSVYRFLIGKYDGITGTLYSNPDAGRGYVGEPIIFNKKLYFRYFNFKYVMASFDGNEVTLVPIPEKVTYNGSPVIYLNKLLGNFKFKTADADSALNESPIVESGYNGSPIVHNNYLYFAYYSPTKHNLLAEYNGIATRLFDSPDDGSIAGSPFIYKNKLYYKYRNSSSRYQLVRFDGNYLTPVSNPDNGWGLEGPFYNINNIMYSKYQNPLGKTQLAKFDGSDMMLIPNPDSGSICYDANPVSCSSKIFFGYADSYNRRYIATYDGSTISLIANPDSGLGYFGTLLEYNGEVYFGYRNQKMEGQLAKCDGERIWVFPNPDNGMGYREYPIIYNKKLYFMYANAAMKLQLAQYDGNSIKLIPNTFMGSVFPEPPPAQSETGPYTQSLSNIVEMKTNLFANTMGEAFIYPNPAHSEVKIICPGIPASIQITDISGKMIKQIIPASFETSIDLSGLDSGIYLVSIQMNLYTIVKKLIKE